MLCSESDLPTAPVAQSHAEVTVLIGVFLLAGSISERIRQSVLLPGTWHVSCSPSPSTIGTSRQSNVAFFGSSTFGACPAEDYKRLEYRRPDERHCLPPRALRTDSVTTHFSRGTLDRLVPEKG